MTWIWGCFILASVLAIVVNFLISLNNCHVFTWICQALIWTFFEFDNWTLPPFAKIMQGFVLMQNTYKRAWIGLMKFLVPFFKKVSFWPILNVAEIKHKVYNTYFSFQFYNLVVLKVYLLVEVRSFKIFSQRQL